MSPAMLSVMLLVACGKGDPVDPPPPTNPQPPVPPITTDEPYVGGFQDGQFCNVQAVLQVGCVLGCHDANTPSAGLDLETDPYGAIVGIPGSTGQPLVLADYPDSSLLYLRMNADPYMPPTGKMDQVFVDVVRYWIETGALNDCDEFYEPTGTTTDYTEEEPYHPPGWEASNVHGLAANLQTDGDCRNCHGANLDGGTSGQSCDECHDPGWRTDCVFCHGGLENQTGAPPEDIDNSPVSQAFPPHTEHVYGNDHVQYGCNECHEARYDVLTPGHVFDDVTAGYGEPYYGNGLSIYGTYLFGTCSNLYCHGSGQADDGTVTVGDTMFCYSCHPDAQYSGAAEWALMGGQHERHLVGGNAALCYECHYQTTDANQTIIGPTYHVNGYVEVDPSNFGVTYNNGTCDGTCHNHNHNADTW